LDKCGTEKERGGKAEAALDGSGSLKDQPRPASWFFEGIEGLVLFSHFLCFLRFQLYYFLVERI
jgi:hypothetical protein